MLNTIVTLQLLLSSLIQLQTVYASSNIPQTYQSTTSAVLLNVGHPVASQGLYKATIQDDIKADCPIEYRGIANVIVESESKYNPFAVGDFGTSFGAVQIHLPAHPDISKKEAEDIDFSAKFLCDNLVEGNGKMWSTYPVKASVSP